MKTKEVALRATSFVLWYNVQMKKVYIDLANLTIETKKKNEEIDFRKLYVWLKEKYKTESILIFTGFLEKYNNLYEENKEIGYEYIFKEAVFNKEESKIKANCDVDISIHGTLDTIENQLLESILITSDGDFASLVKFWKERNVKVKIISPANPDRCSYLLKKDNNSVTYIKQVLEIIKKDRNEKALDEDETS